jgi:hypothetical protein
MKQIEQQVKDINRISSYIKDFSIDSSNIRFDIDEIEELTNALLVRIDNIKRELVHSYISVELTEEQIINTL